MYCFVVCSSENTEINASWHVKSTKWGKRCIKNFTSCSWNYIHVEENNGKFVAKKINGIEFETTNVLVNAGDEIGMRLCYKIREDIWFMELGGGGNVC